MLVRRRSGFAWVLLIVGMSLSLSIGCRNHSQPVDGDANVPPAGEPDQYSATVVRIVENGTGREEHISREVRSGEKRREEWSERDLNRALIWRPDLGKSFLLDLDGRVYVELGLTTGRLGDSQPTADNLSDASSPEHPALPAAEGNTIQAIDHYFRDRQPPTRIETRVLPSVVIDGHSCAVYEQREFFPDARAETTTRFYARDLSGLVLRIESRADQGSARVITERRDIRIDVPPDVFVVPADFKKVEKLPR